MVPSGALHIVAGFVPAEAFGRVQPGQPARLRLQGFPPAQYGSVHAVVSSVASEVRDGRVRVELALAQVNTSVPMQHGLPGTVEVEVEQISPAALVLRAAGRRLDQRAPADVPSPRTVRLLQGHGPRLLAPEVVQTSAMDCGPAALKCVLEGHGIHVSYARLRDACQTDVDGTSIDTMETVANQLGLAAEQIVIPADHLLLPEAASASRRSSSSGWPTGMTHFVVAWRRHGPLVQVMDPSGGRRWMKAQQLLARALPASQMAVPAGAWREWAGSSEFQDALATRLTGIGISRAVAHRAIERAASEPSWAALGAARRGRQDGSIARRLGWASPRAPKRSPSSKRLNVAGQHRAERLGL